MWHARRNMLVMDPYQTGYDFLNNNNFSLLIADCRNCYTNGKQQHIPTTASCGPKWAWWQWWQWQQWWQQWGWCWWTGSGVSRKFSKDCGYVIYVVNGITTADNGLQWPKCTLRLSTNLILLNSSRNSYMSSNTQMIQPIQPIVFIPHSTSNWWYIHRPLPHSTLQATSPESVVWNVNAFTQ